MSGATRSDKKRANHVVAPGVLVDHEMLATTLEHHGQRVAEAALRNAHEEGPRGLVGQQILRVLLCQHQGGLSAPGRARDNHRGLMGSVHIGR
jgi:hypothetical protein